MVKVHFKLSMQRLKLIILDEGPVLGSVTCPDNVFEVHLFWEFKPRVDSICNNNNGK